MLEITHSLNVLYSFAKKIIFRFTIYSELVLIMLTLSFC